MKRCLALFLMLCMAAPLVAQKSIYFDGSFDEAIASAQREGKQLMVFYYSDG